MGQTLRDTQTDRDGRLGGLLRGLGQQRIPTAVHSPPRNRHSWVLGGPHCQLGPGTAVLPAGLAGCGAHSICPAGVVLSRLLGTACADSCGARTTGEPEMLCALGGAGGRWGEGRGPGHFSVRQLPLIVCTGSQPILTAASCPEKRREQAGRLPSLLVLARPRPQTVSQEDGKQPSQWGTQHRKLGRQCLLSSLSGGRGHTRRTQFLMLPCQGRSWSPQARTSGRGESGNGLHSPQKATHAGAV